MSDEKRICEEGSDGGLFLPLFSFENELTDSVRVIIYGALLLYTFYGTSVVCDYFMAGIETITSKKKLVPCSRTGRMVTVLVWNRTVANLTLLALGSSAPEILLSLVEMFQRDFYSGQLGPSTIVGSAAFNLFIIIAVCIFSIPSFEIRRVQEEGVYCVTILFSIFAYIWLLMIVTVITPDVIDIIEGLITIIVFPILVVLCFYTQQGVFGKLVERKTSESEVDAEKATNAEFFNPYDSSGLHPRVRSKVIHRVIIEHRAAVEREYREQARGSMARGRASQVMLGPAKTIMLPCGEPLPVGDDGEILRDFEQLPIYNDNGVITFTRDVQEVVVGSEEEVKVTVFVLRRNGDQGQVSCRYYCRRFTAMPGYDYREATGVVVFDPEAVMATIELVVLPLRPTEDGKMFQLILDEMTGGAFFNPNDDGGKTSSVLNIVIKNKDAAAPKPDGFERLIDKDQCAFGVDLWKEQIFEALEVQKVTSDEEDEEPNILDYIIHCIAVPWKVFYAALTPPAVYFGGWLLFGIALVHVGVLTAVICDLAGLFGCVLRIEEMAVAIIVVAPGTSLPDLFASTSAAKADETADASIVNVTGSNSVNVFLGIGLPWTISAIYWQATGPSEKWRSKYPDIAPEHPKGAFIVKGGNLPFTVLIFTSCSVIALSLLRVKRVLGNGELGGPPRQKYACSFTFGSLYVLYVVLSLSKSSAGSASDVMGFIMMGFAGVAIIATAAVEYGVRSGRLKPWQPDEQKQKRQERSESGASLLHCVDPDPTSAVPTDKDALLRTIRNSGLASGRSRHSEIAPAEADPPPKTMGKLASADELLEAPLADNGIMADKFSDRCEEQSPRMPQSPKATLPAHESDVTSVGADSMSSNTLLGRVTPPKSPDNAPPAPEKRKRFKKHNPTPPKNANGHEGEPCPSPVRKAVKKRAKKPSRLSPMEIKPPEALAQADASEQPDANKACESVELQLHEEVTSQPQESQKTRDEVPVTQLEESD